MVSYVDMNSSAKSPTVYGPSDIPRMLDERKMLRALLREGLRMNLPKNASQKLLDWWERAATYLNNTKRSNEE